MNWTIQTDCDVCGCNRCAFRAEPDGSVKRLCNDADLLAMVDSYLETALWSSTDESNEQGGDPLDDNHYTDDISDESFVSAIGDCESFLDCQADLLSDVEPETAGHNFWLSRNGHGAGFFDSGAEHADALQDATKPYGSVDLYVGDDGKVYGS